MMPSWSSPYGSDRSSCLVFDTSRKAARISDELTIRPLLTPLLPVKRQARLRNGGQRNSSFGSFFRLEHGDLRANISFDTHDLRFDPPSVGRAHHVRPSSDKAFPILSRPERSLARRRLPQ